MSSYRRDSLFENGYSCAICGYATDTKSQITVDHIIPRADGGTNDIENLQLLCGRCNQRKNKIEQRARNEVQRLIELGVIDSP